MTTFNENEFLITTGEYKRDFWNAMRGKRKAAEKIQNGRAAVTDYALPLENDKKLQKAIKGESLFRNIATVVTAYNSDYTIYGKDCNDLAAWVPEGGEIPVYVGANDFERYSVDRHKLAVFVKLDDDFINDASFSIENYLTWRLARNIAKCEDYGFVRGDGVDEPTGILSSDKGAEISVTTDDLSFDDIVELYLSLDDEYQKNAVWLMNRETALALRTLKDDNGNYIWNHTNDTIFSKPVYICNDMSPIEGGTVPVVYGDFSYYWIVLRSPVRIRTLKEKFITLDQVGYLANEFLDGKLIRREAVKALQIN